MATSNVRTRIHRLMVNAPILPVNTQLDHVGTAFQISRSTDFTDSSAMIVEGARYKEDGDNILTIENQIQVSLDEVIYSRYAYIYAPKGTVLPKDQYSQDNWSRMSSTHGDQSGFKFDNIVITTPDINIQELVGQSTLSGYKITLSGYKILVGAKGTHASTTWEITDTDNQVIYSRVKDEDNKTELVVDANTFDKNKLYFIRAKFVSSDNGESNFGCRVFNPAITANKRFELTPVLPFCYGQQLMFRLKLMTANVVNVRIVVKEVVGDFEIENYNQLLTPSRSIKIPSATFDLDKTYRVYASVKVNQNGVYETPLTYIDQFTMKKYDLYPLRVDSDYTANNGYVRLPDLHIGAGVINTREFKDGSFILGVNDSRVSGSGVHQNEFILYAKYGDTIRTTNVRIQLPAGAPSIASNDLNFPYVNVLPLYDDRVVINYVSYATGNNFKKSVWACYSIDYVSHTFTPLFYSAFEDEGFATSMSSSAVVTRDNKIYYIPAEYWQGGNRVDLPLMELVVGPSSFTRNKKVTAIKSGVTRYMTMCPIGTQPAGQEEFLIIGGSGNTDYEVQNQGGFVMPGLYYSKLENLDVFKYRAGSTSVTNLGPNQKLPVAMQTQDLNTASCYNLAMYQRADGKLVIFNNSPYNKVNGATVDTRTWLIDLDQTGAGFCVDENNDSVVDLPFRTTIATLNGDFLRVAHEGASFPPVIGYMADFVDLSAGSTVTINKNLVVKPNERVAIENPYLYDTIEIQGTSDADTGILTWIDSRKVRTFTYVDRIITRNTEETQAEADAKKKENLIVLDGIRYSVSK